jgi:hypothetical protein
MRTEGYFGALALDDIMPAFSFSRSILTILVYIYLGYFVCLCVIVCVCVCVTIAERSAILLVLIIKLTKETRRRVWRGRDREMERYGKGQIGEGGCE